jgi:CRP-like cAMP-binding protein
MSHEAHLYNTKSNFVSSELGRTPLWNTLSPNEQSNLFSQSRTNRFDKNELVVSQDNNASHFFFVLSGAVRMPRVDAGGRRKISAFAFGSDFSDSCGDFVGVSLFYHYPFCIESTTETILCSFPRKILISMIQGNKELENEIFSSISTEYLRTQTHLDIVMDGTITSKVARFLLFLSQRVGQEKAEGTYIRLSMSREDIADHIATTTESVSRAFTALRQKGAILHSNYKKDILRVDQKRLRHEAYH